VGIRDCNHFAKEEHLEYLPPKLRMRILENFHLRKGEMGPGKTEQINPVVIDDDDGSNTHVVPISQLAVNEAFDKAMAAPLKMAQKMIKRFASRARRLRQRCLVVVTGGTSRHDVLRARLAKMCKDEDSEYRPFLMFARDFGHNLEYVASSSSQSLVEP
jgi:hypothetical protein